MRSLVICRRGCISFLYPGAIQDSTLSKAISTSIVPHSLDWAAFASCTLKSTEPRIRYFSLSDRLSVHLGWIDYPMARRNAKDGMRLALGEFTFCLMQSNPVLGPLPNMYYSELHVDIPHCSIVQWHIVWLLLQLCHCNCLHDTLGCVPRQFASD